MTVPKTGDLASIPKRHTRALALSVAASVSVHAIVLVASWHIAPPHAGRVEVLQVELARVEPPRALPMAPVPPRERTAASRKAERPQEETPPRPRPKPERSPARKSEPAAQPPLLAVQAEPSAPEPAFTVPAREPPSAPPKEAIRTAPKAESAPAEKITPPIFNAAYLRNPGPVYPVSARRRGEQGTVMLKVVVTREGAAASVSVDKTSGFTVLDQAALDAVRKWRFAPARQGAEPVESSVLVPIVFRLEGVS